MNEADCIKCKFKRQSFFFVLTLGSLFMDKLYNYEFMWELLHYNIKSII